MQEMAQIHNIDSIVDIESDLFLIKLAREIAINHYSIDQITARYAIKGEKWAKIKALPRFLTLLEQEIVAWQGALNTHERVRLKSAAMFEMWLEEANKHLYAGEQSLANKIELGKLVAKIAGLGIEKPDQNANAGENFSVTINIGENTIKVNKEIQKTIDADPVDM